jgi:ABC-type polysaccharide/polyol phosphate transport system ATPase subunit
MDLSSVIGERLKEWGKNPPITGIIEPAEKNKENSSRSDNNIDLTPVIIAEHITKYYNRRPQKMRRKGQKLNDYLLSWFASKQQDTRFLVLNDVNLKVCPGETVGLVGSNGSGKSTLLRILTGISQPTSGTVTVNGDYRELFALNAGFIMDLSGLKNIYLYAAMKNIPQNFIEEKIDAIIDFSGLEAFIDEPVKTYSTGMRSRLGFSIIVNTAPDIMFIDEALGAGDEAYRKKSTDTLLKIVKEEKRTLLVVSHSLATLEQLCTRLIWLENGTVQADGPVDEIIDMYRVYQDKRNKKSSK